MSTTYRHRLRVLWILLVIPTPPATAAWSTSRVTDRSANRAALIRDAVDGRLDEFSLLHASLLASDPWGDPGADGWIDRFHEHAARCLGQMPTGLTKTDRAHHVFRYMHDQILLGPYQEQGASVAESLQYGRYNCVTSTVLFVCLCREAGIPAVAVAVPKHVLVKLGLDSPTLVETTYPRWRSLSRYDPRIPGIHHSREISDVALLSRFYYNQAISWAQRADFPRAIQAARCSCQLDPGNLAAQANLLATINNWSIRLCARGNFEQAARLVQQGLLINSSYEPLVANDAYVHQAWIAALRRDGKSRQADEIQSTLRRRIRSRQPDADPSGGSFDNWRDAK